MPHRETQHTANFNTNFTFCVPRLWVYRFMLITWLKHLLCNESCRKHQLPWWHKRLWNTKRFLFGLAKQTNSQVQPPPQLHPPKVEQNVGWAEETWITELWVELSQQTLFTTNISVYNCKCLPCWTYVFQKLKAFFFNSRCRNESTEYIVNMILMKHQNVFCLEWFPEKPGTYWAKC